MPFVPVTPATASSRDREAEERVGGEPHRLAGVRDEELRHLELERALDDERDRAARDGVRREVVAVRAEAGHADEERPRRHAARVVREIGDVDGGGVQRAGRPHGALKSLELDGPMVPPYSAAELASSGTSGETWRYWSAKRMMSAEGGRGDRAAPDRALGLVDGDEDDDAAGSAPARSRRMSRRTRSSSSRRRRGPAWRPSRSSRPRSSPAPGPRRPSRPRRRRGASRSAAWRRAAEMTRLPLEPHRPFALDALDHVRLNRDAVVRDRAVDARHLDRRHRDPVADRACSRSSSRTTARAGRRSRGSRPGTRSPSRGRSRSGRSTRRASRGRGRARA